MTDMHTFTVHACKGESDFGRESEFGTTLELADELSLCMPTNWINT